MHCGTFCSMEQVFLFHRHKNAPGHNIWRVCIYIMTLLEFTIDGDSSATGSQTFTLVHTYTFRTLRLKHVIYHIANENLYESWSKATSGVTGPDRKMYAPLYLDVSGLGVQTYDQFSYHSNSANNTTGLIAIGHSSDDSGTSDNTNKITSLDLDLIKNEETTWAKDGTVTLAVKYSSVETDGAFATPAAFDSTSWDDSCRITAVFELDDMQVYDDATNGVRKEWVY